MPIYFTFIARILDGLPLVASFSHTITNEEENLQDQKLQAKKLLKSIQTDSNQPSKVSVTTTNNKQFHYMICSPIVYLTLTEISYPKRVIYSYLSVLRDSFLSHIQSTHGPDWHTTLSQTVRPYAYIHYDPVLSKHQRSYQDPESLVRNDKLTQDLADIHDIMKQNINSVLNRGEALEGISDMSNNLIEESKKFTWGAKKMRWKRKIDEYILVGMVVIFLLGFGVWKIRR